MAGAAGLGVVARLIEEIADDLPPAITLDTSFDELALDSLKRLELLVLVEERHGVWLPDSFLEAPTVGDVVQGIVAAERRRRRVP